MGRKSALVSIVAVFAGLLSPSVGHADENVSMSIARFATPNADRGITIWVTVTCAALPGSPDFQEAHAGAGQVRTGAGAEGGLDGTVVCDGTPRLYSARLTPHTDSGFSRGPARANASLFYCNIVADEQVCAHGSVQQQVIVKGPVTP